MKKDIAEIVSKCLTCQQVKLEHQRPSNFLQRLPTPKWKWDMIAMDLVSGLPRTLSGYDANIEMASYEALYGRRCRSPLR